MNRYVIFLKTGQTVPIYSNKALKTIDDLKDFYREGESFAFDPEQVVGMIDHFAQLEAEKKWQSENSSALVVPK
jgi:hypothetical protein